MTLGALQARPSSELQGMFASPFQDLGHWAWRCFDPDATLPIRLRANNSGACCTQAINSIKRWELHQVPNPIWTGRWHGYLTGVDVSGLRGCESVPPGDPVYYGVLIDLYPDGMIELSGGGGEPNTSFNVTWNDGYDWVRCTTTSPALHSDNADIFETTCGDLAWVTLHIIRPKFKPPIAIPGPPGPGIGGGPPTDIGRG